jgi:hypothetical protein
MTGPEVGFMGGFSIRLLGVVVVVVVLGGAMVDRCLSWVMGVLQNRDKDSTRGF